MRTLFLTALALGGSALLNPLTAQDASAPSRGARVLPWVGCWTAVDGIASQERVCVLPSGARELRIVSVADDGKTTESALDLGGARTPVDANECTGWEQSRITKDGDRILVDAELKCGDSPPQRRMTAFVIMPSGHWLQVNGVGIATIASAKIRIYSPAESYAEYPAEIRAAIAPYVAEAEQARLRMLGRSVSATDLVELESMGVATPVIDLVVAASYPKSFVISAQAGIANAEVVSGNAGQYAMARSPFMMSNGFPMMTYYDMMMLEDCMRRGSFNCGLFGSAFGFSAFGASRFGYGYANGFGPYFGGGYWPGGVGLPVSVSPANPVPSDRPGNRGGGRAVRGQGYTAGSESLTGSRTASPRSDMGASTSASGSSGASSTAGSSGSTGSSSGSSGTRTAQPRVP
jgi:hypothetical protein